MWSGSSTYWHNMLPSIRHWPLAPQSISDTPTQRARHVKTCSGEASASRTTRLNRTNMPKRRTDNRVNVDPLTNYCGENCKSPRWVLLCCCLFPQLWHVRFHRRKKKSATEKKNPNTYLKNIHSVFSVNSQRWRRREGGCPVSVPRPSLRTRPPATS